MNIALDILLLLVVALCLISGWRKGFVSTVMKLASFILAGVGAYLLSPIPSSFIYGNVFLPKISSVIEGTILSGGPGMTVKELFETKPDFFVDILNKYSTQAEVEAYYNSAGTANVKDISRFMAEPIARTISDVLCYAVVFILLLIALHFLTILLDRICHLPVLKGANTLLGLLLGLLLGFLFAWLLAALVAGMWPSLAKAYPDIFPFGVTEDTVILKWLYNFNPLTLFK